MPGKYEAALDTNILWKLSNSQQNFQMILMGKTAIRTQYNPGQIDYQCLR